MRGMGGSQRSLEAITSPVGLAEMRSLAPGELRKVKLTQS